MSVTIALVGGPADGRTFTVSTDQPPWLWRVPIEQPLGALLALDPLDITPMPIADYEPILERGWPSLTDDGRYRYAYRSMEPVPHYGQSRPTPTLDELAAMFNDPPRTAYPDNRVHLLACRTRHSLRRDAGMNPEEEAVIRQIVMAHVREALAERHRED